MGFVQSGTATSQRLLTYLSSCRLSLTVCRPSGSLNEQRFSSFSTLIPVCCQGQLHRETGVGSHAHLGGLPGAFPPHVATALAK